MSPKTLKDRALSSDVPARDLRAEARLVLRQWLASDETEVLARIDGLGRQAIAAAAEASARLGRGVAASEAAQASLNALQTLAQSLDAPTPARGGFFRRKPVEAPTIGIDALVDRLDRERDDVARSLIVIETDRKRLRAAADGLDAALDLVRACARGAEAAAREIAGDRPDTARFFRDTVAERLLAREQDLLTQSAVTQQGVLTLGLIADGQTALGEALARARDTSVAALRTAIAARQALAGSQTLARQTAALETTVGAAQDAQAGRGDVRRILDDALTQARAAIDAAEAAARRS